MTNTSRAKNWCERRHEYAMAEQIREILVNEQEHQIDLATALGVEVSHQAEEPAAAQGAHK